MVAVHSLSESDVAAIRDDLSAGTRSTVWFTPTAVGVPTGGSAKVVSVGEPTEGEFIQVRPAGSRDSMFCAPSELTRVRPPRARKPRSYEPDPVPAAKAATGNSAPSPVAPATRAAGVPVNAPAAPVSAPKAPASRRTAELRPPVAERRAPSAEVTVTLFASTEGEWTVEVTVGKKRLVRSLPVQAAEVAKAARSLPSPVTEAIEASLAAARKRQTDRVEQLRAELEAAQLALRELDG